MLRRFAIAEALAKGLEKKSGAEDRHLRTRQDEENPDPDKFSLCFGAEYELPDERAFSTSVRLRIAEGEPMQLALYFTFAFGGGGGVSRFIFFTLIGDQGAGQCFVQFETDLSGGKHVEQARRIAATLFLDENGPEQVLEGGLERASQIVGVFAEMR